MLQLEQQELLLRPAQLLLLTFDSELLTSNLVSNCMLMLFGLHKETPFVALGGDCYSESPGPRTAFTTSSASPSIGAVCGLACAPL